MRRYSPHGWGQADTQWEGSRGEGEGHLGGKDPVCLAVPDCRYGTEKLAGGSPKRGRWGR